MEDRRAGMGVGVPKSEGSSTAQPLAWLREAFPGAVIEASLPQGDATAVVRGEQIFRVMEFLKNDPRMDFNILVDITAVDYADREPRFDVVYHLLSLSNRQRLRIKVRISDGEPFLSSLCPLWGSANWLEREVWDMFGIRFAGHPNLKRILL